jgi:uncharacterized repeat protein (TIGR01451 family)
MLTMPNGTEPAGGRGIGTYVLGQPTTGAGIRTQRYSTSTSINTETYDSIKSWGGDPHFVGEVWAEMLWEMTYALIGAHGFSADFSNHAAGNSISLQLVMDGMKLQPCSPGFVDARNAILAADQADNGGANQCLIWNAFAKRGLGFSAVQNSTGSATDGTQAFDLPAACNGASLTATVSPDPIPGGSPATYSLAVHNTSSNTLNGIVLTSTLGATTTYVAGSATCGGTFDNGTKTVTFTISNLAAGATRNCSLQATAQSSPVSAIDLDDDFEPNLSNWTVSHASGTDNWVLSTAQAHSPTHSAFASDPIAISDKYLQTLNPLSIQSGDTLSFWHKYTMEDSFDGGVVEVSTNGGSTWSDVGAAAFTQNGYDKTISTQFSSPISGRSAFTGGSDWKRSIVNLNAFAGQNILVRFRAASDSSVGSTGWYVDDVTVGKPVVATNHLVLTVPSFATQTQDLSTLIVAPSSGPPGAPTVTNTTPSPGAASVAFTPGSDGGSPITGFTAQCVSTDGGVKKSASGASSPITVTNLTGNAHYHCRVKATNAVGTGPYSGFGSTVLVPVATTAPPAPTVTNTTPSAKAATVAFSPNGDGGSPITGYTAQCVSTDGGVKKTASGASSPLTVTNLTGNAHYHCRVKATNAIGTSPYSAFGATVLVPVSFMRGLFG